MSHNTRRSYHGATRVQPAILKSRKRKLSENDIESSKFLKKDPYEMHETQNNSPLEDVTATSLNVDLKTRDRAITPETGPEDWQKFKGLTCYPTPQTKRNVPLPILSWADREQVWELMCRKDKRFKKNPFYISRHPSLQPKMRSILLDWITEVCEVYKMHRETYYLATEYIDRFLSLSIDLPKSQLQLVGITCLFIAAKIEEIYPPKLSDYAYVTDGACTVEEILDKELVVLKVLEWDITPVTINCWLNTYLQLLHQRLRTDSESVSTEKSEIDEFIFPKYSGMSFVQVARLLDLCILDIDCLNYTPSKLAATAVSYLTSLQAAASVSGYSIQDMNECYVWMAPFAHTIQEMSVAPLKAFASIPSDDIHNIQTHSVNLDVLELVQARQCKLKPHLSSPPKMQDTTLTPPTSDEKIESEEEDVIKILPMKTCTF